MTDHMLIMTYDPSSGWSAPAIRPYGPLSLDPASSCFHYSPNLFEGMKVSPKLSPSCNNLTLDPGVPGT
jgi:branched-subunit amino acid aminotransferase/4-amino-4-deoxychorismate lyase